jgi:DNA-binding NarL/FixJ family response regulator
MAGTVMAVVEDLLFFSKIQQAAKILNVEVAAVAPSRAAEKAGQGQISGVIVDLNHRSGQAVEVIRALKAAAASNSLNIIAFASHVQTELIESARAAGCDRVLARSAFSAQLPNILAELAARPTVAQRRPA